MFFQLQIKVSGDPQNAGFCTIYPRASGGLKRPPDPSPIWHLALQGVPSRDATWSNTLHSFGLVHWDSD